LKIIGDSVLENQNAAMLEPYRSTGDRGSLYFDQGQLMSMIFPAADRGFHVVIHTIGDRATRAGLDAAQSLRESGRGDTRFALTHVQMVHPDDRDRFAELDVTVQTTGNWAMQQPPYLEHMSREVYDTEQFPLRSWANSGANLALGADWPATPGGFELGVNPFNNIYTAMHRRPPAALVEAMGSTPEPLAPEDQTMTLAEAVEAYTMGSARMLGIDDQVGSIEVGKKADLIVLDRNLLEIDAETLPDTSVLSTIFGGETIYTAAD